jgi:Tfp pilus assembly protein PilN
MINVINFLPNDYMERRGRRCANLICLILGGVAVLGLGLASGLALVNSLSSAAMRAVVEQQYQEASLQIKQLKELEERKAALVHKVELSSDLLERVPRSHLLARLTNYLPQKASLTALVLKLEDVAVPAPRSAAQSADASAAAKDADKAKSAGKNGKGKPDTIKVKQWTFHAEGLAPTDMEVAEYISRLAADPLFRDVDLQYSESFPYRETLTMRKFQLSFRLSPDAEKMLGPTAAPAATAGAPAPAAKGQS